MHQARHLGPRYVFSFFFLHFFCILTQDFYFYRFYLYFKDTRRVQLGDDRQNGPKWHVRVRRLGLRYMSFSVSMYTTNDFCYLQAYICIEDMRGGSVRQRRAKWAPGCIFFRVFLKYYL